jgi:hypothetical protein
MRSQRVTCTILIATMLVAFSGAASAQAGLLSRLNANLVPSHGVLLGIFAKKRNGRTHTQEIRHVERQIGRRFAIDHFYMHFDDPLADAQVRATINRGRIPLINWAPEGASGIVPWGAITAGRADRTINRAARALRHLNTPVMLAFNHEPENDTPRYGTPGQYKGAFRHIVQRFRAEGASKVVFVCILEGYTYEGGNGGVKRWYPGRRYVDWAAADAYNWAPGRTGFAWRSFKSALQGFYNWGTHHHKPLMAAEFGTQEKPGDPNAKAKWFTSAGTTLAHWPRIKAVVYFNSNTKWPWWIDTSAKGLAAFRGLAGKPLLRP